MSISILSVRYSQPFHYYGLLSLEFHWYSCFYMFGVESFQMRRSTYMDLSHWRCCNFYYFVCWFCELHILTDGNYFINELCPCLYLPQAFYLPWAMLALDVIFGSPLTPDLLGIIAGHIYYFMTLLHPLAGGRNILKTPLWVYPFYYYYFSCYSLICLSCFQVLILWRTSMMPLRQLYKHCCPHHYLGGGGRHHHHHQFSVILSI